MSANTPHLKRNLKRSALALATGLTLCATSVSAKTLSVGIDLSGSNPLLNHPNFAAMAAQFVKQKLEALSIGDTVLIKTFGARSDARNVLSQPIVLSRRQRPKKVAQLVASYIQSLPQQSDTAQSATNLLAWLEFTSGFDCSAGSAGSAIVVLTDGLESSTQVSGSALLKGKALPKPEVNLTGCTLTFYGLGAGWPAEQVKTVRKAWQDWADQAGAPFTAIIP